MSPYFAKIYLWESYVTTSKITLFLKCQNLSNFSETFQNRIQSFQSNCNIFYLNTHTETENDDNNYSGKVLKSWSICINWIMGLAKVHNKQIEAVHKHFILL